MNEDELNYYEEERKEFLNLILKSDASHKIIVAGPGTGKTYTFKRLTEEDPGRCLIITLINNLVFQMVEEIGHHADVRTFHSFSKAMLHKNPYGGISSALHFFPKINKVISQDSIILNNSGQIKNTYPAENFGIAFRTLDEANDCLNFFLRQANYYDTVGFDDAVYRVLLAFNECSDRIPVYHNVMVDEYQDFNLLEVELINSLESKNKVLIVGDDDQSIYHFRQASPIYLRQKANDSNYARFSLPFSTRCTSAVISLVEGIILKATSLGLLADRIKKDFRCYLPKKIIDNENYPKIKKVICSVHRNNVPYISKYIEKIIDQISEDERKLAKQEKYPLILIIGKSHYIKSIFSYLKDHFSDIEIAINSPETDSVLDAYRLLLEGGNSNLGWRLIIEHFIPERLQEYVEKAFKFGEGFLQMLELEFVNEHNKILDIIKKIITNSSISEDERNYINEKLHFSMEEIIDFFNLINENKENEEMVNDKNKRGLIPTILLTNFNGSKGLSAGYTFITGFDEGVFPKYSIPNETEVCQFIVAVTRTRKQCHLIHVNNFLGNWTNPSIFWHWVPRRISEVIEVNKNYFPI